MLDQGVFPHYSPDQSGFARQVCQLSLNHTEELATGRKLNRLEISYRLL